MFIFCLYLSQANVWMFNVTSHCSLFVFSELLIIRVTSNQFALFISDIVDRHRGYRCGVACNVQIEISGSIDNKIIWKLRRKTSKRFLKEKQICLSGNFRSISQYEISLYFFCGERIMGKSGNRKWRIIVIGNKIKGENDHDPSLYVSISKCPQVLFIIWILFCYLFLFLNIWRLRKQMSLCTYCYHQMSD